MNSTTARWALLVCLIGFWVSSDSRGRTHAESDRTSEKSAPLQTDLLGILARSLAATNSAVVVAQYQQDGIRRDLCRYPAELHKLMADKGEPFWFKLLDLGMRIYFVQEVLAAPDRVAAAIYVTEELFHPLRGDYRPRYTDDDSMWVLLLEPGHLGYPPEFWESPHLQAPVWKPVLEHTNAPPVFLQKVGLSQWLTRETWFWVREGTARMELNMPCPPLPELCAEIPPADPEDPQSLKMRIEKRDKDRVKHGFFPAELVVDLRLILKQMGGRTGADRLAKITATEKEMQTDLGKALLRELRAQAKTRPATPR